MDTRRISIKVTDLIFQLGWGYDDEVVVEVGGTAVSGIHQAEGANERWSTPFGLRKYNKDAFIVIKNVDRNPVVPLNHPMKFDLTMDDFTIIQNAIHYYKHTEKRGNFQKYDEAYCNKLRDKLAQQLVHEQTTECPLCGKPCSSCGR